MMRGTNEILVSKHGIAKVKQGHFETAILVLHNVFFVFYYGLRCLQAMHLNFVMIQLLSTVM